MSARHSCSFSELTRIAPVMLNDQSIYEYVLRDDVFTDMVGILECASGVMDVMSSRELTYEQTTRTFRPTRQVIETS